MAYFDSAKNRVLWLDELAELTDGLDKTASKLLLDAIGSYEVGNTLLKQLLDQLDQT